MVKQVNDPTIGIRRVQRRGSLITTYMTDGTRVVSYAGAGSGLYYPRNNSYTTTPPPPPDPDPDPDPPPSGGSAFKWPMNPSALNERNGRPQDGYLTAGRPTHNGVDMSFPPFVNLMQYKAVCDGTITYAQYDPQSGGGHSVFLQHDSGWTFGYFHGAHTESAGGGSYLVSAGQRVTQGTPLMLAGSTGNSTGPHLHFVVADLSNGGVIWNRHVNPNFFMRDYNPNNEFLT